VFPEEESDEEESDEEHSGEELMLVPAKFFRNALVSLATD
jgi:hypothetical protein